MASTKTSAVPTSKYKPKKFDTQKYNVSGYQYPSDLMGSKTNAAGKTEYQYGHNYVVFYINVNNESKMIQNQDNLSVPIDASERVLKQAAGREYTKKELAVMGAAVNIGGAAAAAKLGVPTGVSTGAAAGNLIGGAAVFANTENSTFSRPQKRLKSVIAMHVPNQLSIRYGAGWSEEETFGMQAIMEGGRALARAVEQSGGKTLSDKAKELVTGTSSSIASKALQSGGFGGALSTITGLASNPMKEQAFKGMDFRTFTMEYQFAPRDETESMNVNNIIKAFKYHMHPEFKDSNNFLFLYPSEFDIEYFFNGSENMNIHRHTSCVLTEMNVNYTPNGNFSTFRDGSPTQITMNLTFKELTVITKELIAQGL